MKKILGIALFLIGFAGGLAGAQDRPTANIKVQATATTGITQFICRAQIQNTHDDSALNARAVILLPIGVSVQSVSVQSVLQGLSLIRPSVCEEGVSFLDGSQGVVPCFFGLMAVGESRIVTVKTKLPPAGFPRTCAALAWSQSPDPQHDNNFDVAP